mgnify:CR=1 FL=1|tara:strand:- start:1849 stop:2121 length:273 start_codon:yes stop_codon:yes gene_type:complete
MKEFDKFIEEAASKRCPAGQYYCFTDEKCKKIPMGYHIGRRGYLENDKDDDTNGKKNGNGGNGNGNGNGGNGNGGNGNGGSNGGGNGGGE